MGRKSLAGAQVGRGFAVDSRRPSSRYSWAQIESLMAGRRMLDGGLKEFGQGQVGGG